MQISTQGAGTVAVAAEALGAVSLAVQIPVEALAIAALALLGLQTCLQFLQQGQLVQLGEGACAVQDTVQRILEKAPWQQWQSWLL